MPNKPARATEKPSDAGDAPTTPADDTQKPEAEKQTGSRLEQFEKLARQIARGESAMSPKQLSSHDRRLHVRQTIREDHVYRIASAKEATKKKFDRLASSVYSFFRGTALLFYRDMAGEDAWMPTVLALGDVHPLNFGVMPNADNVAFFAVNDFDDAYYAPFTWDLKRGATGFMIAAKEVKGYKRHRQKKIASAFVTGYIDGIKDFAVHATEADHEIRTNNAPKLIRKLLESAQTSRAKWLEKKYLDESKRGFRSSSKLTPVTERRAEFQAVIDEMVSDGRIVVPARAAEMRVKDVAIRHGQGTASLGLPRYYLLIEGVQADGSDDLIIEFKRARRSAIAGLAPPNSFEIDEKGERIAHAQSVHVNRPDLFFSHLMLEGKSFISRERAPYRDDINLAKLTKKQWARYAAICGWSLSHAHALSDESGFLNHDIEPVLLKAIQSEALFRQDILRFSRCAAKRIHKDHRHFVKDYRLGAFEHIDTVFQ